jgi:hypothetical protein
MIGLALVALSIAVAARRPPLSVPHGKIGEETPAIRAGATARVTIDFRK